MDETQPSIERQRLRAALTSRLFDAPLEPTRIGRYVVLEPLGQGAMGTVYLAHDPDLDRKVAVKVLSRLVVGEMAQARLRLEAKTMARLSHPNVVVVHEVGHEGDAMFIAMEYVAGGTLAQWCRNHSPGTATRTQKVVELALQAARGLAAAHDAGLVHRDLKPANVLIGDDGRVRVADFGLAREQAEPPSEPLAAPEDTLSDGQTQSQTDENDLERLTRTGQVVGTPAYMAPEQFRGHADARSDQFAWCVTTWEALLGERPFAAPNATRLLAAVEAGEIRTPPDVAGVSPQLLTVLRRGLRANPAERWPTMESVLEELEPQRRASRWPWIVLGSAAVVSAAMLSAGDESTLAPCGDGREALEPVWGTAARESVAEAIRSVGTPSAEETIVPVHDGLDAIAERWAEASERACRDGRSREPELVALAEARRACLTRALDTFSSLTADIRVTDRSSLPQWVPMVLAFDDAMSCDADPMPSLGSAVDPEVLADYDRAQLLIAARQGTKAEALLRSVVDRAPDPGRLRAQALYDIARSNVAMGDWLEADPAAKEALAAAELTDAPAIQLHAWRLIGHAAEVAEDRSRADLALARANNLARRPEVHEADRARLDWTHADVAQHREQYDEALARYESALAVYRNNGEDELRVAAVLQDMSGTLMRTGEPNRAAEAADESVTLVERVLGPGHPRTADALMHAARFGMMSGREGVAERLERSAEIWAAWPDFRPDRLVQLHETRATLAANEGRTDDALAMAEAGLRVLEGLERPFVREWLALGALHGQLLGLSGRFEEAGAEYRALVERFGDQEEVAGESLGVVYVQLVLAGLQMGDVEQARRDLANARRLLDGRFPEGSQPSINYRARLSMMLRGLGEPERALAALPDIEGVDALGPEMRVFVLLERVQVERDLRRFSDARQTLARAKPFADQAPAAVSEMWHAVKKSVDEAEAEAH